MNLRNTFFISSLLFTVFLLAASFQASAQEIIYLQATDDYNGKSLDVEFRIESAKSKRSYTIKNEGSLKYVELPKLEDIIVKAFKDGYYVEEHPLTEDDLINNNYEIKLSLQKRPTAKLVISALSEENNSNTPASFDVFYLGKMIGRGNTTRNVQAYELLVEQDGMYIIKSSAKGFDDLETKVNVTTGIPETRVNAEITLQKEANEVAIRLLDEQVGTPVKGSVSITNANTGDTYFNEFTNNGTILFTFRNNISYKITVNAENYNTLEKSIYGRQLEDLTLRLKQFTYVDFKVADKKTKRPLEASIQMVSPSGKKETVTANKYYPTEQGNYKVIASAPGYLDNTGTVMVNSLGGGKMDFNIELTEGDKQYYVKVIDHYSKQPLNDAQFRVFGPKGEELRGIKQNEEGEWVFLTDGSKDYILEAQKETYQDFTTMLKPDQKKFTVELFWSLPFTHTIKLIDKYDGAIVNAAALKVLNDKGQDLFVFHDVKNQAFKVKYDKSLAVSYSVVANGYKDDLADIVPKAGNNVELVLEREDNQRVTFYAVDYLTDKPISAAFKYYFDNKQVNLQNESQNGRYTGDLNSAGNYRIEATLSDYLPFNSEVKKDEIREGTFKVRMKRKEYPANFKITNLTSAEELTGVVFQLKEGDGKIVNSMFSAGTKSFGARLQPDIYYSLNVNKEGYESYTSRFTLSDLVETGLTKTFELVKIPEPEIPKPEPVAVKPPEPKLKEEPKQEVVYTEPANEMPATAEAMAAEFNKPEALSKRYILDKVYFDQSSANIRESEVPQLMDLAKTLANNTNLVVRIVGYTDNVGDPRLNLGLSKFRAKAVANYLFYHGADPARIFSDGFGQEKPVDTNDTEEQRARNRRVELELIEN
ncbi:OmpA family protein [Jiulongibacter sp. NS-SX5]|uniref:OmpA family protein n=1 Tax=Jiulongibacter sp. NS-SX5 TaxID=3463854 RepID=UPI004057FF02